MRKSRFSEDQIIAVLKEHTAGISAIFVASTGSATQPSISGDRSMGGLRSPTQALEEENRKPKKLPA